MKSFLTLSVNILLTSVLLLLTSFNDTTHTIIVDCGTSQELSFSQIPRYTSGDVIGKRSLIDGRYYEQTISFKDNITGLLFQGGNSQKYFIEDPTGTNYYYQDKNAVIRALYIYKKYGCTSTSYR
jgi:hypothetical protein